MATAIETIQTFMGALKNYSQDTSQVGLIALDEAVRRSSFFSSLQEATPALQYLLSNEEISADTDTRLQKVTGMVLGGTNDFTVDTGAITGSNAGGFNLQKRAGYYSRIRRPFDCRIADDRFNHADNLHGHGRQLFHFLRKMARQFYYRYKLY